MASVTGDGHFDRDDVYAEVAARHPEAAVVVPPRANAVPSEAAETAPAARRASAMYRRARPPGLAESPKVQLACPGEVRYPRAGSASSVMSYVRKPTGDTIEVAIAADVLNRMLELGRPKYVRIA